MLPPIVTFWHGPLDRLRQLCLRSQVAAGHKVTVYSFEPLAGLPDGVGNAEAEAVLPHAFAEKLRPSPDGVWRDWTTLQFSDFFRMRLMARNEGLWLDADVLLLKPVEIDPAKPFFAWERPRQLGNSVLYLPPDDPIVTAFASLMRQDELTPDWLALRHRLTFALHRLRGSTRLRGRSPFGEANARLGGRSPSGEANARLGGRSPSGEANARLRGRSPFGEANARLGGRSPSGEAKARVSDIRVALYGPAALTALARRAGELHHALPKKSFYAVHAEPKLFFERSDFSALIADPEIIGFHISPKGRGDEQPAPGSLYSWAAQRFADP